MYESQRTSIEEQASKNKYKKISSIYPYKKLGYKESDNYFSYVIQASIVFLTASRAYGIYDKEYHVIAND
jgi:7,8-dihydro-6-hydroxymethylpterin-pyrophosphokinase